MLDCPFHSQIDAYHDGELDADVRARLEAHLAGCGECRGGLAKLSDMSALFAARAQATMLPLELARLHRKLDGSVGNRAAESEFLRTAGMLSALAASILVISGVWLAEFPSRPAAILSPGIAVVPASDSPVLPAALPDWERTALTLRVEPSPLLHSPLLHSPLLHSPGTESPIDQTGLADAGSFGDNSTDSLVADLMVAGLNGGVARANP
jgi:anti-sigma factor RsiW